MTGVNVNANDDKDIRIKRFSKARDWIEKYFQKWAGQHQSSDASTPLSECLVSFVGTLLGLGIISLVHYQALAKYSLVRFCYR